MAGRLDEIEQSCNELESLERQAHLKDLRIPKDWFWHRGCFDALRKLKASIEEELVKMGEEDTYSRALNIPLKYIGESLRNLLEKLGRELKRIENEKIEYDPGLTASFNHIIKGLDYWLLQAIKAHKLLEKYAAYDIYSQKKRALIELGLNVFKNPEITQMMLIDDSIAETVERIFRNSSREHKMPYLWESLRLFYGIIFQEISIEEVAEITSRDNVRPYLRKGPAFFEEHGADSKLVDQVKRLQNAILSMKYTIIILSRIYYGSSEGEFIDKNAKEDMPKFRQCIRDQADLELFYSYSGKLFRIDDLAPCYILLKVIPCFRESLSRKPNNVLSKLEMMVRTCTHKKFLADFIPLMKKAGASEESLLEHSINLMNTLKGLGDDVNVFRTNIYGIFRLFDFARDDEDIRVLIKLIGMHDKMFFISKLKQKREELVNKIFVNRAYSSENRLSDNLEKFRILLDFMLSTRYINKLSDMEGMLGKRNRIFDEGDDVTIKSDPSGIPFYIYGASCFGYLLKKTLSDQENPFRKLYQDKELEKWYEKDKRFFSVEGLASMGFITVHVTNAFAGGAAVSDKSESRTDPFENIIKCIQAEGSFMLSASTLNPKYSTSLVKTNRFGIKGSIGVIFGKGYISEAHESDASTVSDAIDGRKRTCVSRRSVPVRLAVTQEKSKGYNEIVLNKWVVSGLFYTKDIINDRAIIGKLIGISGNYNLPIYEIDDETRIWKAIPIEELSEKMAA